MPQIVFSPVAEAAGSGSSDHQSSLAPDAQDEIQGNDRHPQVSSFFASAKHTTFSHHVKLLNPLAQSFAHSPSYPIFPTHFGEDPVFFIRTAIILGLWFTMAALPQTATPFLPQAIANAEEFEEEESEDNISESDIQVQHIRFPITLLGSKHTMAGVLYVNPSQQKICSDKDTPRKVKKCFLKLSTLQVLVHGLTYNHTYWDPYGAAKPGRSYARFMAKKGYVVLALDLLGTGASSVPNGEMLNFTQNVISLVQVLTPIRSQQHLQKNLIRHIALVGHSGGTILSVLTAGSSPHIADFLIATGWSYAPHQVFSQDIIDAALGQTPYIRFPSELRTALFYYTPTARPRQISFDNSQLADQFPNGALTEGLPLLMALEKEPIEVIKEISGVVQVKVPVLVQLGDMDVIAKPFLPEKEKVLYSGSPNVTVQVLENIGHSLNLHIDRKTGWRKIHRWLKDQLFK